MCGGFPYLRDGRAPDGALARIRPALYIAPMAAMICSLVPFTA